MCEVLLVLLIFKNKNIFLAHPLLQHYLASGNVDRLLINATTYSCNIYLNLLRLDNKIIRLDKIDKILD